MDQPKIPRPQERYSIFLLIKALRQPNDQQKRVRLTAADTHRTYFERSNQCSADAPRGKRGSILYIIGIDSAVQDKNIGMVLCEYVNRQIHIKDKWDKSNTFEYQIEKWIDKNKTILAFDSPLGWPKAFSEQLNNHHAGMTLGNDDKLFFKRQTDIDIALRFGKIPLEVSADRIARTAFHTLRRLGNLKTINSRKIEIIWNTTDYFDIGYIEVYPASTLLANKLSIRGYKQSEEQRKRIFEDLAKQYTIINEEVTSLFSIEHDFDAFICCLAGVDFLENRCKRYKELNDVIRKEGWIWTKE
jgi:hypothetical protein